MAEVIKTVVDVELNSGQFASQLRSLQQQINSFNLTLNKSQLTQGQAAKFFADELSNAVNRSKFFRAETVKMQTAASALDSTLRKGQGSLGQFFSAAFNKRSAMAAETFALASERARTMQTQFVATGKAAKGMQDALAIRPLTAFVSQASIAGQRMQILNSMFKQGTTQLINFGKNVQWAGRQLMVGFTVPLTIFGTTAGRVFMDLEKQVVSFKKVYGDLFTTPAELQENLKAVQSLALEYTKYGIAVKDTISLAAQAAAAGRQGAELTDAVTAATRLATLGQMDQNAALDATIALQSAFQISGQELADTINYLNMVENQTVVSLQDIAAAIPRVAPVIKGLGGDVKDLTVFLAAMQEGGVTAEQGANALKSGLASLINPTKAAKETLSGFGINLQKIVDVNRGDLMGTVTTFADALQKLDEFSKQQALEKVFGKFQYARLGALFENIVKDGSQANQVLETMGYSTEELRMTAEKELNTISQSFGVQLIAAMEKFKLAIAPIGELFVKMAIPIVQFITKLANWFNSLPEGVKNIAAIATVITGLVVPAATMMFGLFMNLVGTLAKMSQGAAIFGATLLKRGPIAAIKSLTQSTKYLSLSEIDAANAAQQLGSATSIANIALLEQVGAAGSAKVAINELANSYRLLIQEQLAANTSYPGMFASGEAASKKARVRPPARIKGFGLNKGSIVPGSGNTDTVPAMLTPGEFVVNKESTKKNMGLLRAINGGDVGQFNKGGMIPGAQYANVGKIIAAMSKTKGRNESIDNLSDFPNEVKTKILSGQVKKRSDFTSRSDRALFDNSTNMALSNPSKDDLLDLLTTDHSNLLSNSHLYSIALNKNADDDVLNLLATQFKNRLRYAKPEELGDYLNQTAKIIQDRGIKLNKGGMIPGVQYLETGDEVFKPSQSRTNPDPQFRPSSRISTSIQNIGSIDRILNESFQGYEFSSQPAKAQAASAIEFLQNQPNKLNDFIEYVKKLTGERKGTGKQHRVNTASIRDAIKKFGVNPSSVVKAIEKSHINSIIHTLDKDLPLKNGNLIPKGTKVQFLNNRVLDFSDKINKKFSKGGVLVSELQEELSKDLFKTMNWQLEQYMDELNLTGGARENLKADYMQSREKVLSSYKRQISQLDPNKLITDHGLDGSIKMGDISDVAFSEFGSGTKSKAKLKLFNNVLSKNTNVRIASREEIARDLYELRGKTGNINEFAKMDKLQLIKETYKAQGIDIANPPYSDFIDSISKTSLRTGNTIFDQKQYLSNNSFDPNTKQFSKLSKFAQRLMAKVLFRGSGMLAYNKGGMIPGYALGGLRGKAIFERGNVGVPKIMNLSGLAKNGEDVVIDLVRGGMGVDNAIKFAKLTQTGRLRTGIKTGPVTDIEDYIERKISFERLQGSMTNELHRKFYRERNKPIAEQQKTIDNYNKLYHGDGYNKGGIAKYNKGNIVPGSGNTDTVPAMLTPGEFVVNKDATQKNLGLLHAINAQKLNVGGKVKSGIQYLNDGDQVAQARAIYDYKAKNPGTTTPQAIRALGIQTGNTSVVRPRGAGAAGMAVGMAASLPFMGEGSQEQFGGMGSVVASMVAFTAAQSLTTKAFVALAKNAQVGSKGLGMIGKGGQAIQKQFVQMRQFMKFFKMSNPYVLAIVAATAAVVGFTKLHDNMKQAVSKYNNALYGTSESLENIAKAMGRTTPGQREAQRTSELISGQRATEEEKAMSSQLMNSAEGKSMLQDLQTVKKMGGDQAQALKNQLTQAIMSGVLTPSEARQVATDIGIALKNEKVGIDAVAQITQLVGPEGELIKGNRIEILSQIAAPTNPEKITEQVNKELKRIDDAPFWNIFSKSYDFGLAMQQIVKVIIPNDVLASQMKIETLQNNIIENALKEKEVRASLREEYVKGAISYEEFSNQTKQLNTVGGSLGIKQQLDALNAGNLQYNAAAGGQGSALFGGPLKQIGSLLTGAGAVKENLGPIRGMFNKIGVGEERTGQVRAAEDLANKVTKQFDTQLSDMGMDDASRQDLMKFVTDEFGGNLADQAIFFGDILSGKMNIAAVTFVQQLAKLDPEFQKIIDKYGLVDTATAFSPLSNNQALMDSAQQTLTTGGNLEQVKMLGTNWEKLQALPPEIIKSLKIDVSDKFDVNKFGPLSEDFKRNWEMLGSLDPQLDKEFVFSLIATDASGNLKTAEEIEKDAIKINKAMSDLASGTKQEKAKAQLELTALYNGKDMSDPVVQENLSQLKKDITGFDDFDAATQSKLIEIDSKIDAKGLLITALEKIPNRSKEQEEEYQQLLRDRGALEKDLASTASSARIAGASEQEKGEESAFQKTKKSFEETKKYQKAIVQLTKQGVSGENIALVDQASLLEMSTSERKKAIDMMKQQQDIQKTISVMLLSDEEQRIRLQQNAVKIKDNEITQLNRQIENVERLNRVENQRIEKLQRQNELDGRQVEIRNRALTTLADKEKVVNDAYSLRSKALDKVAQMNDRLAQQQQDRISLAGALVSGDFGAAASAAATMSSNFASAQLEDTKAALENQREKELATLTADVNGQLFTRVDLESQIDTINERVYQRNLSIQSLQDVIQKREEDLQPIRDAIFTREGERLQLARDLEDAEYNKWKTEMDGINASILKWNEYWKAKRGQGGKALKDEYVKASNTGKKPNANSFGGFIRAANGGMINYRGSNESPPALRANVGMEVPGVGLSDKVPALLTPGEFVVRKSVAQANMPLLKSLNANIFPKMSSLVDSPQIPISDNSVSTVNAPVYNNYSVNVNVAGTDASANDIASAVMSKIKMNQGRSIRGSRV